MKHIIPFLLIFAVLLTACSGTAYSYTNPAEADAIRSDMKYIIHAAGTLTGLERDGSQRTFDGSNSVEGLKQCEEAGCRFVELDFSFTSDGELVCLHDWYSYYSDSITDGEPLTLDEFKKAEIFWNFMPASLDDVIDFLKTNPDTYIITDVKDDNIAGISKIGERCPDMKNRFIVQIYAEDEYAKIRELGFEYIIYTLYRLDWNAKTDYKSLSGFAESHPLIGFTFSYELCDVDGFVDGMLKSGVPLYIHTVNDETEQQKYFDMGISAIYTDNLQH